MLLPLAPIHYVLSNITRWLSALSSTMSSPVTTFSKSPKEGQTFAYQDKLPKLPVPPLEDTCRRYLGALRALQNDEEHQATQEAVKQFLENPEEGRKWQHELENYASTKDR
jgi:carnitine O-acetyltransferase